VQGVLSKRAHALCTFQALILITVNDSSTSMNKNNPIDSFLLCPVSLNSIQGPHSSLPTVRATALNKHKFSSKVEDVWYNWFFYTQTASLQLHSVHALCAARCITPETQYILTLQHVLSFTLQL
jgi:hypothetical protein